MIISVLLSAVTLTFTATATGVEKGTAVEFFLVGRGSDRTYEAMFVLDEPIDAFCRRIESSVPRGTPVDAAACRLWPIGCRLRLEPSFGSFIKTDFPEGERASVPIYTGGAHRSDGSLEASDTMPVAAFATYSLPQSPIVFRDPVDQGSAYGRYTAAVKLEKGKRFSFKLIVDEGSLPPKVYLTAEKGRLPDLIRQLQTTATSNDVDATVTFSGDLTVEEAVAVSQALAVIDSSRVKINGSNREIFYRAFLPLEKWRDRQERLHQPFELTLKSDGTDKILFIEEDWTVEGNDPKLTPRPLSYEQAARYPETDTCFIYTSKTQTLSRISRSMARLSKSAVRNWYVFSE